MPLLDRFPLVVIFLTLVLATGLAVEVGFRLGRRIRRGSDDGLEKYPIESSASATILGLLAFILAFAFGVSASRFADLREIARLDIDATEDLYVMADLLDDEPAAEIRSLLREYHRTRFEAISSRDVPRIQQAVVRSEEIQDQLWKIIVRERKQAEGSLLNPLVGSVHELMDTHGQRVQKAFVTRLPPAIWGTTAVLLLLSSLLMGLSSGLHGRRSLMASMLVIACFTAVITMVVDLDRPIRSLFQQGQNPTAEALLERMVADESPQAPQP